MTAETYATAAKAGDIPEGEFRAVQVRDKRLLICHVQGGGFHAVDDTCTHDDGPLADGWLEGDAIECPRHGARFDVKTGKVLCLPAAVPINAYPVRVAGGEVQVDVTAPVPQER